jgi:thiamine pyrophosphokinase
MNALVLCNGEPPPQNLFEETLRWSDLFIAADGGGNIARSLDALPDYVIGDLDSYKAQPEEKTEVIHQPEQETNDLEKALKLAIKGGGAHVKVLAATGLRLDHTLKNLSVLKQFNDRFREIIFIDDHGTIRLLPRRFTRKLPLDTSVSLFPLSGKVTGITTKGLKYALDNETLENGIRDGSSNSVVGTPVTITHRNGDLLLFVGR